MAECRDRINNRNASKLIGTALLPPDWTTLDISEPFLHPITKEYNIAVDTNYPTPGGDKVFERLEEAKLTGVKELLKIFNKVETQKSINTLLASAKTPDYFVPERPNPPGIVCFGLKVLVTVPSSILELVPNIDIQEELNTPLPRASHEMMFVSSDIKDNIAAASKILEKLYLSEAKRIANVNLQTEAIKLRKFVFALERHLISNGYSIRREQQDLIIVGIDSNMKVLYVLIDDGSGLVRLSFRFDKFQNDDPVNRPITIEYVSKLDEILSLEAGQNSSKWTEVFSNFTIGNLNIKPSFRGSADVGSRTSVNFNKILDVFDTRDLAEPLTLEDVIEAFDSKSAKTEEEKEEEDRQLLSSDFKAQVFLNNKDAFEFVGDVLLDDLENALEKVNSLEEVYQEILDKFGMQCLIAFLIKCLSNAGVPDPCTLTKSLLRGADCGKFINDYQKLTGSHPLQNPQAEADFRRRAIECIKSMSTIEREAIFSQLNSLNTVSVRVVNINDVEGVEILPLAEVMGVLGNRILNQTCDATRNALVESIPNDCFNSAIDLLETSNGSELFCNFKIPTINLPDFLPTFDIMGFITVNIETALLEALAAALVQVIKQIIRGILNCGDFSGVNFGDIKLNDLISADIASGLGGGINLGGLGDIRTEIFSNISAGLGLDVNETEENRRSRAKEIEDMMDDLFTVLTPGEFSSLLDGRPTFETRKLIGCLIKQKYENLQGVLDDPTKIDGAFKSLGDMVDKRPLLRQIGISEGANKPKLDEFCNTPYEDIRKSLLDDKGLTPEEIDEQLDLARKRRADQLADLLNLLNKEDVLDGAVPPIFCKKDSNGNVIGGIIPRDPPSFKFMLDKTADAIYDGVHMSFNQEIAAFPAILQEPSITTNSVNQTKVMKMIKTKFTDREGKEREAEILNPEYVRLVSSGISTDDEEPLKYEKGSKKFISVDSKNVFESPNIKSYVANGLRDALKNIEFNNGLFDVTNRTARFIIPLGIQSLDLQPGVKNSLSNFKKIFDQVQNSTRNSSEVVGYTIDYEMGVNPNEDRYKLSIGKKFGNGNVEKDFVFERSTNIDKNALVLINQMSLENAAGTAAPEGKFAHFIAKVYADGCNIYKNGNSAPSQKPVYARGLGDNEQIRRKIYSTSPFRSDSNGGKLSFNFGGIRGNFHGRRYYEIFRDFYAKFSSEVANSPLFRKDIISKVNWLQVPLDENGMSVSTPGCNPHLLDIDKIKKKMKDDYYASECEEQVYPSTDGMGSKERNPLEQSGISGAVQAFIRLYVIELVLRSIFVISEIKSSEDEDVEDLISQYFAIEAQRDLQEKFKNRDPEFFEDFSTEAINTYNIRIDRGEINGPKATSNDLNNVIGFFVQEQLKDVNEKISKMVSSKQIGNNADYNKTLLERWIPLFDVPENPGDDTNEARFGKADPLLLFNSTNVTEGEIRKNKELVFNLENGNFILERYVRVVDRSEAEAFKLAKAKRITGQRETDPMGKPIRNRVQPHVIQEVVDRPEYLKGVVKLEAWESFIKEKVKKGLILDHAFEEISLGLRLVYLPAVDKKAFLETLNGEKIFGDERSEKQVFDEIMSLSTNTSMERMFNKSFGVYEKFSASENDFDFNSSGGVNEVRRIVYPIPLVSVENSFDLLRYQENLKTLNGNVTVGAWESVAPLLEDRMIETPEYSFLFRYAIPINRMNTLAIIYCITYLSSMKKLRELFDGTKQQLKSVFQTLQNGGNYQYEDEFIKNMNGNAGLMKKAQGSMNTEPKIDGLSLSSMSARTPMMILKGLVELTDTNIKRARKIVNEAKEQGRDISMISASLLQMPMNVIPPPPIGQGVGVPITPLGFVYLALDMDSSFEGEESLRTSRESIARDGSGIDLSESGKDLANQCEDEEGQ